MGRRRITAAAALHSKAKEGTNQSILMLDLASQHPHQFAERVCDPSVREDFNARTTVIEPLLQIAREKEMRL